jgi:hypothetical protein
LAPTPGEVNIPSAHGHKPKRKRHQRCTNQTDHYIISMTNTRSDNLISIAEWKAKHQRKRPHAQAVPVYVPVRDADGR